MSAEYFQYITEFPNSSDRSIRRLCSGRLPTFNCRPSPETPGTIRDCC